MCCSLHFLFLELESCVKFLWQSKKMPGCHSPVIQCEMLLGQSSLCDAQRNTHLCGMQTMKLSEYFNTLYKEERRLYYAIVYAACQRKMTQKYFRQGPEKCQTSKNANATSPAGCMPFYTPIFGHREKKINIYKFLSPLFRF